MDREERIRRRAYNIWCAEGRPKGREQAHWEQASKEVEREARLNTYGEPPSACQAAETAQQRGDVQQPSASRM